MLQKKSRKSSMALWIALLLLLSTGATGCGLNNKRETIKIGVAGTMSGANSDLSVSGRRGAELAAAEINRAGGINGSKLELVVKDDKNNADTALEIDKQFANEGIKFVIGHYTSGMIVNNIDYINKQDMLFLAPTISADALSGKDDNFIRFIATTQEQAVVLADCARKLTDRKLGVIYDMRNKAFCEPFYNHYKQMVEANGAHIILTETFISDEVENFPQLAKKASGAGLDGIFIIADAIHSAALTQQLRKVGSNMHIYAPLWANTPDLFRKGGTALNDMIIVGAIDMNDKTEKFNSFKKNFYKAFGENPTFSSMYTYEAMYALEDALTHGNMEPTSVKKYIIKKRSFQGLQGNYQIDSNGDNLRAYMVFQISDGNLKKVDLHE